MLKSWVVALPIRTIQITGMAISIGMLQLNWATTYMRKAALAKSLRRDLIAVLLRCCRLIRRFFSPAVRALETLQYCVILHARTKGSVSCNSDADVYFVYSMSERIKKWAEEKASGSTFLEISGRQLETMPVNLPSLVEQQAIGSFFSHLDDSSLHQRKRLSIRQRSPCGHKHNQRRNVVLRLLLAMGRRLQGRRDSGSDNEEIQAHTGVAEKTYP